MHRLLSLVLLAAFGFPVVAPALSLVQDTEASLPACCRRNGAHHCSMRMHRPTNSAPEASERCPNFPQPSSAPLQVTNVPLLATPSHTTSIRTSLLVLLPASVLYSLAIDFALYQRGPPSYLLS